MYHFTIISHISWKKNILKKKCNHQGSSVVAIILFKLWNSSSSSGSNTLLSTGKCSFLWPTIMAATSLIYISCRRCQFLFKLEADLTELIRWKYCRATCSWTRTFVMPLADAYPQKSTFLFPIILRAEPLEEWRVGVELKSQMSIIKVEIQNGYLLEYQYKNICFSKVASILSEHFLLKRIFNAFIKLD